MSSAVAERAAVVRRQMKIKMQDAIILATAEVAGRELVTRNVKDFPAGMRGCGCLTGLKGGSRFARMSHIWRWTARYGAPDLWRVSFVAELDVGHPSYYPLTISFCASTASNSARAPMKSAKVLEPSLYGAGTRARSNTSSRISFGICEK
jgi:hypothetical protein